MAKEKLTGGSKNNRPSLVMSRKHLWEEMRTLLSKGSGVGVGVEFPSRLKLTMIRITSCSSSKCLPRVVKLIVKLEWLGKQIASWWVFSDCVQGWCHLASCLLGGVCAWGGAGLTHLFANLYQSQQEPVAPLGSLHSLLWGIHCCSSVLLFFAPNSWALQCWCFRWSSAGAVNRCL